LVEFISDYVVVGAYHNLSSSVESYSFLCALNIILYDLSLSVTVGTSRNVEFSAGTYVSFTDESDPTT
jgi:hypothetical protein